MKEFIEIPFGAKDSELGGWEYNIPEGYTASIKNGKIIVKKEESDDEKIRKELIEYIKDQQSSFISAPDCRDKYEEEENNRYNSWISWLEKQGDIDRRIQEEIEKQTKQLWKAEKQCEPKFRVGDVMRTWQEAFNGIKDGLPVVVAIDDENYRCNNEIISITDQEDYEYPPMNRKQNPAWSEEDERMYKAISIALSLKDAKGYLRSWYKTPEDADDWLKSLKERYTWKPSDEQMAALSNINVTGYISYAGQGQELINLYNELKKLKA